jgi:hypothetical protein
VEKQILSNDICHTETDESKLIWTGSKVDFVELVYAIYCTGRINNGKISLKKLFHVMCKMFNIEINDYARIFMDIKNRVMSASSDKRFYRTKFLFSMIISETQYMEKADQRPSRK